MITGEEKYMLRCLQLAALGAGYVAPNPMVGAVLVYRNKIIGEGYHKAFGGPHAEVNCIADAEANLSHLTSIEILKIFSESTVYVSLEPCSHYGKTPPCADLLIEKKIGRVVIGSNDPFDKVNGRGVEKLKAAGVNVEAGLLQKESDTLNRRFIFFQEKKRPYIILKWAESADGFISKAGETRYAISNKFTNHLVHKWRSEESAIMVGTNTAITDNPSLTTRLWPGKNPVRIIIDKDLKLEHSLSVFNADAVTIIANFEKQETIENITYLKADSGNFLQQLISRIYEMQLQSVFVEGGQKLLQSFIDLDLWDEARVIRNTGMQIFDGTKSPVLYKAALQKSFKIASDKIFIYHPL